MKKLAILPASRVPVKAEIPQIFAGFMVSAAIASCSVNPRAIDLSKFL